MITGQVVVRDTNTRAMTEDGTLDKRKLVFIMGVLAVPDNFELKGEHQYTVVGSGNDLTILPESAIDLKDRICGLRADQVLTSKLWRV